MKRILILTAIIIVALSISAQRSNKNVKSNLNAKSTKTEKETDKRIEQMIAATQNVMFIDSIVVDKKHFLTKYRLNAEAGSLHRYNEFFNAEDQPNSYVYLNELGDKCYYSIENPNGDIKLYTSDFLNENWTSPTLLEGIYDAEKCNSLNYPFMMADGTTLYFSATGSESIGGYDIFVTRFDSESGLFLKPENIGMPFNSTGNDYMYAVDELDSIGWFVTDRNQTKDKVCIYIFIPSETRHTYSPDEYTEEQIHRFSRIARIADTWEDRIAKNNAIKRLRNISQEGRVQKRNANFHFVINDNSVYTKLSDFHSTANAGKFKQLQSMKSNLETLDRALETARNYYAKANIQERNTLKVEIIKSEQQYEYLEMQIKRIEKEIRNSENSYIKQ